MTFSNLQWEPTSKREARRQEMFTFVEQWRQSGETQRAWCDVQEAPMSGAVYIFLNHKGDRIKLLRWGPGDYVMYCKMLERGRFRIPNRERAEHRKVAINYAQLAMLIEGLGFKKNKQKHRYLPHNLWTTSAENSRKYKGFEPS